MDDYLGKPFTLEQLKRILDKWLQGRFVIGKHPGRKAGAEPWPAPVAPAGKAHEAHNSSASVPGAPLDENILNDIRALQKRNAPGILNQVIHTYLAETPQLLERLGEALQEDNAEVIRRVAHTLKSSSANVGALTLAGRCQELEALAQRQNLAEAPYLLTVLTQEYDLVRRALSLELQGEG
jgi:HPt (histidine-containing phosphotransfer) domain-containing protein